MKRTSLEAQLAEAVHKDEIDTMSQLHDTRILELRALCRIADSLALIAEQNARRN